MAARAYSTTVLSGGEQMTEESGGRLSNKRAAARRHWHARIRRPLSDRSPNPKPAASVLLRGTACPKGGTIHLFIRRDELGYLYRDGG